LQTFLDLPEPELKARNPTAMAPRVRRHGSAKSCNAKNIKDTKKPGSGWARRPFFVFFVSVVFQEIGFAVTQYLAR
jgi:hypothetical protein